MTANIRIKLRCPADKCGGKNYELVQVACANLDVGPRTHSVYPDGTWFTVYCFGNEADAKGFMASWLHGFMAIFGGEKFNPADRGRGRSWVAWRKRS